MEDSIFKFEKTGENEYTGTCGHVSVKVRKSPLGWTWSLEAEASRGNPSVSRSGYIKDCGPERAQYRSIEEAFCVLDDIMETGCDEDRAIGPREASALQAVWELLTDAGCEPAQ